MNENNDNFGLDSIQPLEPVTPVSEPDTSANVFGVPSFYTEPKAEETNTQYAFTSEEPTVSVESSFVETPIVENTYSDYVQVPTPEPEISPIAPTEIPVVEDNFTTSYTEMPIIDNVQQPMINDVNEHPNAKIELHKESNDEIPIDSNLPREKMDKGTFWLLILLFVGLLAVIIALPYVFNIF